MVTPQNNSFGVELTPLDTAFNNHAGASIITSAPEKWSSPRIQPQGQPNNFDAIQANGAHGPSFSNVSGMTGELKDRYRA